ncbi:MAG: hypothetical protein DMF68_16060, partial [Acidobacteria bacterium]
ISLSGTMDDKKEILTKSSEFIKSCLSSGWTIQQEVQPAHLAPAASNDPNTSTETIMAEQLIVSADENGKHFKIKGGRYKKHGVSCYAEYLQTLGISEDLKPGAYDFKKRVVVQTTRNGEGKSSSKVIALA